MWSNILKAEYKFPFHMYEALREVYYGEGIPIDAQPREDLVFMLREITAVSGDLADKLSLTRPHDMFTQGGDNIILTREGEDFMELLLSKIKVGKNLTRGLGDIIILEY
tara:strand:+ start:749 stop:1075 length:327 start_codon:yes stop_codon:yes gene_type:complete